MSSSQRIDQRSLSAEELEQRIVFTQQLGAAAELDVRVAAAQASLPPFVQSRDQTVAFRHASDDLSRQTIDALINSVERWGPSGGESRHNLDDTRFWRKSPSSYAPEVTKDGIIVAKRLIDATDPHTMVNVGVREDSCFHHGGSYTQQDFHYRITFDVRHPVSETPWLKDHGWALVMQMWGPREDNESARNPPFSIFSTSRDGQPYWVVRSYGDSRLTTQTGQFEDVHTKRVPMRGIGEWHRFDVEFVPNPFGNGMVRTWLDGILIADWQNIKSSYNSKFDGRPTGPLNPGFGLYSSADDESMEVHLDNIEIQCSGRFESSITGKVVGPNLVEGHVVVATDSSTGESYGARTDKFGVYVLPVPKGSYSITAIDWRSGNLATSQDVSTIEASSRVDLRLEPLNARDTLRLSAATTRNETFAPDNRLFAGSWFVTTANRNETYEPSRGKWWDPESWPDMYSDDFGDSRDETLTQRSESNRWTAASSGDLFIGQQRTTSSAPGGWNGFQYDFESAPAKEGLLAALIDSSSGDHTRELSADGTESKDSRRERGSHDGWASRPLSAHAVDRLVAANLPSPTNDSGDANLDGTIDFGDYVTLAANFGQLGGWADGDFDGNGEIGLNDLIALAGNFNL